jgi:hypothetical protein
VPLVGFTIQGPGLFVLRHFLAENERTVLELTLKIKRSDGTSYRKPFSIEDYGLTLAAENHGGHVKKVHYMTDGSVYVSESWGSVEYWDAWAVSRGGQVEYVGTTYGTRYRPAWLERAIEEAKAKGTRVI